MAESDRQTSDSLAGRNGLAAVRVQFLPGCSETGGGILGVATGRIVDPA